MRHKIAQDLEGGFVLKGGIFLSTIKTDNAGQERKKICSCITITRSYRGWITLDTLLAVKAWDKPNRNLLIAIDVEDQDDRPMRAADFFRPADCTEASKQHNGKCAFAWLYALLPLKRISKEIPFSKKI